LDNLTDERPALRALWSAAACCRFCPGQLAGRDLGPERSGASKLAQEESGSKLPHSKAGFQRDLRASLVAVQRRDASEGAADILS